MLSRFRKVKNRVFGQENKPEEVIETDLDWIWQPFETSENLGFSVRVKKIASAIIESSPDDIPEEPLKLDPRLVIPLCAIQLRDEINLTRLRSFNEDLDSVLLETNLDDREKFVERVVIQIKPTERWQYLFKSLTPELQFALLSRLIQYRSPRPNDWRNIYEEIEYDFHNSREYRLILLVVFLLSLGAVFEIFTIIISQPENWLNSLMAMAIVVVLSFLLVLWQETRLERDESEPTSTSLIKLGLLGFQTFGKEWLQLLRKNRVGEGVTALFRAVARAESEIVDLIVTGAVAGSLVGVGALVGTGAEVMAMAEVMVMAVAGAVAGAGALGWGLGIWYKAKKRADLGWIRFFSILAFPWFCWLPIVVGFMSFALYDRLSWGWQPISLFWLSILGFCTALWVRGKTLEEKALNPLKGILGTTANRS